MRPGRVEPAFLVDAIRHEMDAAESALALPGPAAWLSHRDLASARLAACQAIDTARAVLDLLAAGLGCSADQEAGERLLDLRGSMRNAAHVIDELRTGQGF